MDERTKQLQGSPNRDKFKKAHKQNCGSSHYASDIDFVFVEKYPPGIAAFLDYKQTQDGVTFAEVLAYNVLMQIAPIYLVYASNPETGPFDVYLYESGDYKPNPPKFSCRQVGQHLTWQAFSAWEESLRGAYRAKFCVRKETPHAQ